MDLRFPKIVYRYARDAVRRADLPRAIGWPKNRNDFGQDLYLAWFDSEKLFNRDRVARIVLE